MAAFLRADTKGNKYALAKRFGVQEIICNCRIWTSARASEGLGPYGACPTTSDTIAHRDHVHIGQNLRGANRQTTAYTGWSWCEPRDGMCSLSQPRAAGGVCRVVSHAAYRAVAGVTGRSVNLQMT